mmetsp:Transcript_742/g.1329  ORF Transcript_742/g.1329 Transcript_742/m.1329 type:complete len:604 (-) Transcript_742:27-1838(-)
MWWTKSLLNKCPHAPRRGIQFVATSSDLTSSKTAPIWAWPGAHFESRWHFDLPQRSWPWRTCAGGTTDSSTWIHFLEDLVKSLASEKTSVEARLSEAQAAVEQGAAREEELRGEVQKLRAKLERFEPLQRAPKEVLKSGKTSAELELSLAEVESPSPPVTSEVSRRASGLATTRGPQFRLLYASPLSCGKLKLGQLKIEDEVSAVSSALHGAALEVDVATVASLRKAFSERNLWLHLSLHCVRSHSSLVLERTGGYGGVHLLQAMDLQQLLRSEAPTGVEFLFLSACDSADFGRLFRAAGVKHVVCCTSQVGDTEARQFASLFYHELAKQQSLRDAFESATCHARLTGDVAGYELLSDDSPLDLPYLQQPPGQGLQVPSLPRGVEDFVGRKEVMENVLRSLASRRCVVLHCEQSYGRSAALVQIGRYACLPGRLFSGRVAFFPRKVSGGLWIVDDADELLEGEGCQQLRRHLESEGAALLLGCRAPHYNPFQGGVKAINVALPALSQEELAELFLRRCQRRLCLGDIELEGERSLGREEAFQLLQQKMAVFRGLPGLLRLAAAGVFQGSLRIRGRFGDLLLKLRDTVPDLSASPPACMMPAVT